MTKTIAIKPLDTENDNICIHCALCCDGSIFTKAKMHTCDDVTFLKEMGCEIVEDDDKRSFLLPCKGLKGTICTLYYDKRRFKVCRGFKCRLLKEYTSGEISYHSALDTIREVQKRRQSIKVLSELIPTPANAAILSLIRALRKSGMMDELSFRRAYAKQILDCLILEDLLKSRFYGRSGCNRV